MRRRKSRDLTGEEKNLWNSVARTVVPLPDRQAAAPTPKREPDLALSPLPTDFGPRPVPLPSPPRLSPLVSGDPRRERLVARGRLHIDSVLDLHGMRQLEAERATTNFISRAIARGHRVLLVITGKGSKEGSEGRGVLRKRFLHAMESGLYGNRIASVRPAHQRHGGQGAFYVFLKAPKR